MSGRSFGDLWKIIRGPSGGLLTSASTVRQWEIGAKRPSGPSLKLLDLIDRKGLEVLL